MPTFSKMAHTYDTLVSMEQKSATSTSSTLDTGQIVRFYLSDGYEKNRWVERMDSVITCSFSLFFFLLSWASSAFPDVS